MVLQMLDAAETVTKTAFVFCFLCMESGLTGFPASSRASLVWTFTLS
jgi:hypothetical protein